LPLSPIPTSSARAGRSRQCQAKWADPRVSAPRTASATAPFLYLAGWLRVTAAAISFPVAWSALPRRSLGDRKAPSPGNHSASHASKNRRRPRCVLKTRQGRRGPDGGGLWGRKSIGQDQSIAKRRQGDLPERVYLSRVRGSHPTSGGLPLRERRGSASCCLEGSAIGGDGPPMAPCEVVCTPTEHSLGRWTAAVTKGAFGAPPVFRMILP